MFSSLVINVPVQLGCDAISYTGSQVKITTDSEHGKARIKSIDTQRILALGSMRGSVVYTPSTSV
jgi:aspartokinase